MNTKITWRKENFRIQEMKLVNMITQRIINVKRVQMFYSAELQLDFQLVAQT